MADETIGEGPPFGPRLPGLDATSEPINFALHYAELDVRIIPVEARGKKPLIADWPRLATTDPGQICAWFDQWPAANYGLVADHRLFVDVDLGKGGSIWFEDREVDLPETWTHRSGSGGIHVLMGLPEGVELRNRVALAPGIDIRTGNGYLVGPGCLHPDGGIYGVIQGPPLIDMAMAPSWLIEACQKVPPPPTNGHDGEGILEGGRNASLTSLAGHLARVYHGAELEAELQRVNVERCSPPLPEAEVLTIARSIGGREAKQARAAPVVENGGGSSLPPLDIVLADWTVAAAYAGAPPVEDPVVEGALMKRTAGVLAAVGGTGKTSEGIGLGIAIATNHDNEATWLGYKVAVEGTVVMLCAEDNRGSIHRHIHKRAPMLDTSRFSDRLIVVPVPELTGRGSALLIDKDGDPTDLFYRLRDQMASLGNVKTVLPDPLRSFVAADINSDPQMAAQVMRHMNGLAVDLDALVLVPHHLAKRGLIATDPMAVREAIQGVSGIVDHARAVLGIWSPPPERASDILRELAMRNPEQPLFRVYLCALLKANHGDADYGARTLVRTDDGVLRDFTRRLRGEETETVTVVEFDSRLMDLLRYIRRRAEDGRPFRNSTYPPNGILHKANLDSLKRPDGTRLGTRKAITDLLDGLAMRGLIFFRGQGGGAEQIMPVTPKAYEHNRSKSGLENDE